MFLRHKMMNFRQELYLYNNNIRLLSFYGNLRKTANISYLKSLINRIRKQKNVTIN